MTHHVSLFKWPPPKRKVSLSVALPASTLSVEPSLYKKTIIAGFIARSLCIFRISDVYIYLDKKSSQHDMVILKKILEYIETPPHLRKYLIKIDKDLKFAGLLPPLAILSHHLSDEPLTNGSFREGVIYLKNGKPYVNIGSKKLFKVKNADKHLRNLLRVTVKVISTKRNLASLVEPHEVPFYWGFKVRTYNSLKQLVKSRRNSSVIISTSKNGELINDHINDIKELLSFGRFSDILILFGSPEYDAEEIAEMEGFSLNDYVITTINTAPYQGVRSIRTYEALYITLSTINYLFYTNGIE